MKKIILFFAIVFLSFPYFASSQDVSSKSLLDNWSLNINGGASLFWGDIRQYKYYPVYHYETERNVSFGIILSKQLSSTFELRGQFFTGKLSGTSRGSVNRYFQAEFSEFNLNTTINFSRLIAGINPYRKLSFYGIAGFGFVNYRSQKKILGINTVVNSIGYSNNGTVKEDMESVTAIPVGLGFKYQISKRFEVNLEHTFSFAATDLIDLTEAGSNDALSYTSLGLTYKFNLRNNPAAFKSIDAAAFIDDVVQEDTLSADELNEKVKYLEEKVKRLENKVKKVNAEKKKKEQEAKKNKEKLIESIYKSIFDSIQLADTKSINYEEVCLPFSVFFNVNKYNILDSEKQKLASIAELLKKDKTLKIHIIGRTDQSGTIEYNNYLGKKRAETVLNALVNRYKIEKSRLTTENRGEENPFSKKYYSVNRRVDFIKQ